MVNEKIVENIRAYGISKGTGEKKREILVGEIGFPIGQRAEYVLIVGCLHAEGMPHVLEALKNVLDHYKVSYTILNKEYCCGWGRIGRPAVISKNEADIAEFRDLSRGFIMENFRQAKELGAKSIVLFCGACEPNYANCRDLSDLEVISCSELIDRHFKGGELDKEVDYFAGCYRFRRRITDKPVDVEAASRVLNKISGLRVNYLDNKLCCFVPPHREQLMSMIKTDTVVNICAGCYHNFRTNLADKGSAKAKMLPEIVWEAIKTE